MKKLFFFGLFFLITNSFYSQTTIQECANVYKDLANVYGRYSFFKYQENSYSAIDDSGYEIPSKYTVRWYFRFPEQSSIVNGVPLIAKNHVDKIRFKTWFDKNYPSNLLNGFGFNIYIDDLEYYIGDNAIHVLKERTMNAVYSFQDIYLFLGGDNNFPENDVFETERLTFYVYVKEEYKHLYPGGISNGIYQMNVGSVDSQTGTRYFDKQYRKSSDNDLDTILNDIDNCPSISNTNQDDRDGDGIGDVCDNCINNSNTNQRDTDGDGLGDVCDDDDDNDGVDDINDNCPSISNTNQEDTDEDGIGDVCDTIDNNAKPNLTLSEVKVKVGTKTYTVNTDKNETPILKDGENTFTVTIENNDDGYASSSKYKILVSEENNIQILELSLSIHTEQATQVV